MIRRPPGYHLFPYTTLFRSNSMKLGWILGTACAALVVVLAQVQAGPVFVSTLNGVSERPTPVETSASGSATAELTGTRSEEHTSELQSRQYLVCRLLLEKNN